MIARLFCKTGKFQDLGFFEIADVAIIGRNKTSTIRLDSSDISGEHARIYFDADKGTFFIEDMKSRNGTMVGDTPVAGPLQLADFCVITFAKNHDFIFQVVSDVPKPADESSTIDPPHVEAKPKAQEESPVEDGSSQDRLKTVMDGEFPPIPEIQMSSDLSESPESSGETARETNFAAAAGIEATDDATQPHCGAGDAPEKVPQTLVLRVSPATGGEDSFVLQQGDNVVGRSKDCDIYIHEESLSRRHAVITVKGDSVRLRDLGSLNHTFVNDNPANEEVEVAPGTPLRFGLVPATITEQPSEGSK